MRNIKFMITYQHGDTGRITARVVELGQPIPNLGERWDIIGKDQFTGLKDKHGIGIYEGDIVRCGTADRIVIKWDTYQKTDYGQGDCGTDKYIGYHLYSYGGVIDSNMIEIIGNIYENPELL